MVHSSKAAQQARAALSNRQPHQLITHFSHTYLQTNTHHTGAAYEQALVSLYDDSTANVEGRQPMAVIIEGG